MKTTRGNLTDESEKINMNGEIMLLQIFFKHIYYRSLTSLQECGAQLRLHAKHLIVFEFKSIEASEL